MASSQSSSSSTLEDQLFRIYTHYAIHTDSSMPELWRNGTLIRFFKDCQLYEKDPGCSSSSSSSSNSSSKGNSASSSSSSSAFSRDTSVHNSNLKDITEQDVRVKLTSAEIELELAKLLKSKRQAEISGQTKYNTSLSIEFSGFLILLQRFSRKCFPLAKPSVAFRKLLLENVFLLANRRFMLRNAYNIYSKEAREFLGTMQKSMFQIFTYYLDIAEKRRNAALAGKVSKMVSGNIDLTPNLIASPGETKTSGGGGKGETAGDATIQSIQRLKSVAKSQRELLGYHEYLQFCMDFKLRSTSLITAVQSAEVYLEVAPYDSELKGTKGMDFAGFQEAMLYISMIAFRQLNTSGSEASIYEVTPLNKLKALLLFLWKAINGHDLAANMRKSAISSSSNLYGSGAFSNMFLAVWQKDGFIDYTSEAETKIKTGSEVVDDFSSKFHFLTEDFEDLTLNTLLGKNKSVTEVAESSSSSSNNNNNNSNNSNNNISGGGGGNGVVVLTGKHLSKLFRVRPDLKEFVAINITNL